MPGEDEIIAKLTEEHKDDIAPADAGTDDKADDGGGDNSQDNAKDEVSGTDDSDKDGELQPKGDETGEDTEKPETRENKSDESNDKVDSEAGGVGEKKDANSRIRQLNEEKKQIAAEKKELEEKLAEKIEAERKVADLAEDPVYEIDDFVGTLDENGDMLSDGEAKARFKAWEADYRLRQYEKKQVLKEAQDTVIKLQSATVEAFTKFPEFDQKSDIYDPELAEIANEAFRAGLTYQTGHDGDDNFINGSRINPTQLLEKLHNLRAKQAAPTKVNNLGDDNGSVVSSQQVNKKANKYAPGFRGEVDAEIDKLMAKENK